MAIGSRKIAKIVYGIEGNGWKLLKRHGQSQPHRQIQTARSEIVEEKKRVS
jgi:hypothetical protein